MRTLSVKRGTATALPFVVENMTRHVDDKPESPYRLFPRDQEEADIEAGATTPMTTTTSPGADQ